MIPPLWTLRDRQQGWLLLALFAELVLRGDAVVAGLEPYQDALGRGTSGHQLRVEYPRAIPSLELDQSAGYADIMATRWLERALARGLDGKRELELCTHVYACPVCRAPTRSWCTPIHAGERDPGGWLHPAREAERVRDMHTRGRTGQRMVFRAASPFRPDRSWLNQEVVAVTDSEVTLRGLGPPNAHPIGIVASVPGVDGEDDENSTLVEIIIRDLAP